MEKYPKSKTNWDMQQWFTDRIKEALIGRHRQIVHTKIFAVFKVFYNFNELIYLNEIKIL